MIKLFYFCKIYRKIWTSDLTCFWSMLN